MRANFPPQRYDPVSQVFHWVTAMVATVAFTLGPGGFGRLMREGIDPATRTDIVWHESLGVLIFLLTLTRLAWITLRPQAPSFALALWMDRISKVVNLGLWTLLMVLPLTAVLALGSEGHPLTLLAGFRVDRMPLIEFSPLAKLADWGDVHGLLGDALMWLAGLHAVAALYHHFVLRDGVLRAMLPRLP